MTGAARDEVTIGYRPAFANDDFMAAVRSVPAARLVLLSDQADIERHAGRLDGLICGGNDNSYSPALAAALAAGEGPLRWIQVTTAGHDALLRNGVPANVRLTGNGGAFSGPVAEHAMGLLLALHRGVVPALAQAQGGPRWNKSPIVPTLRAVEGSRLAVIGLGGIGREVALRASAFGMKVTGVSRSGKPAPEVADVRPIGALSEVLSVSDAVVLCLPLTSETRNLFDATGLARMKRGSVLVNVGRGALVESDALAAALTSGHLGGAGLDVTEPEPLPDDHALWDAPNTIITPHIAPAGSALAVERICEVIATNVERFASGREPLHAFAL